MTASLINLPTIKAGIRYKVFIPELPAAVNKGVDGRGMSV
jgi:hypothetical protein